MRRSLLLAIAADALTLTFELAARTVDVLAECMPDRDVMRRNEQLERRVRELEQELAASRRVDAARRSVHERDLERLRAGRYWS